MGTLFVEHKAGGKDSLLVTWGRSNKLPATRWFETTEICSLTSGGWKAEMKVLAGLHSFQSIGENPCLASSRLLVTIGIPWLLATSLSMLSSHCLSSVCPVFLCLPLIRIQVIEFRDQLNNPGYASFQDP